MVIFTATNWVMTIPETQFSSSHLTMYPYTIYDFPAVLGNFYLFHYLQIFLRKIPTEKPRRPGLQGSVATRNALPLFRFPVILI